MIAADARGHMHPADHIPLGSGGTHVLGDDGHLPEGPQDVLEGLDQGPLFLAA